MTDLMKILGETAIEKMAEVNGTDKETVMIALELNNKNAWGQFNQLIAEGVKVVSEM